MVQTQPRAAFCAKSFGRVLPKRIFWNSRQASNPHSATNSTSHRSANIPQAFRGSGSGVFELKGEFHGDAFRTVYIVRFREAIYVLHAFKKKSKRGISTPIADVNLVVQRLRAAQAHHKSYFGSES
jgi:phage-related protein